jgi:hypothetical protein
MLALRSRETEKFIDRPLVRSVDAVLADEHTTIAGHEEIGG